MVDSLRRFTPAHSFPSEIEDSVLQIAEVRRAFLKNNELSAGQPVRSIIRESWERCATLIEPGLAEAPIIVASDSELQDLQLRNEHFLKASQPVIRRLTELVAGSRYIIGLADGQGRLLQVSGDRYELSRMERIGLAPGGNWSEATVGTNGIGTAIAVDHAVVVMGPEHFCDSWQDFSCITAPIHYPGGGEIAGVLDISGDYHLVRPFFTGILTAAALEIKQNLKNLLTLPTDLRRPFQITLSGLPARELGPIDGKQIFATSRTVWFHPARKNTRLAPKHGATFKRRTFAAERLTIATGTISASLDFESTLSQVAQQAAYVLGLDSAAVCLLDESGRPAFLRGWSKQPSGSAHLLAVIKMLSDHTEIVRLLHESGEPVAIDNLCTALALPASWFDRYEFKSLALLPLLNANSVNGFITIARPEQYHWQSEDLHLGLTFAFHAASAIENARLYQTLQQHQRHVEALNAVNQLLHMLYDPAQQLDLIVERFVDIMGLDGGMILLNQGQDNRLNLAAYAGLPDAILDGLLEIATQHAVDHNSVLLCQKNLDKNPLAEDLCKLGMYFVIIAPLAAGNDLLGVLLLGSREHRELTNESLTLFTSIGQQLGLALKNAQLLRSAGETHALREADRIKSRFLMMVSHDLRSPLTAIHTSVESLLDMSGQPSADSQEHLLRNIASQSKRLGRLVDQLLDLTRIEASTLVLDRDWTELGALIEDSVAKFERLNAPCKIQQNLASGLPLVYIDPERIIQVVWNLLENAHKYAPAEALISVEAFSGGSEIFISVADRGPGIPVEDHEKIFQYFYRQPREQALHTPGSGLGLAICRGIVSAHGGRIWVEDRLGGGSIFFIALPHSYPDPAELMGIDAHAPGDYFNV